jgi:hypothetical protein
VVAFNHQGTYTLQADNENCIGFLPFIGISIAVPQQLEKKKCG